ncbi:hypothetical protein Trco_007864 [Trichoderma cornu-damae]|uniref:Uncharacterized protein n=1 Tax=Trichoderma cornu-damae TaxID=654480 RepID=A0A9P8TTL8_9HYPO|nr:hypothetical protein Trco_007864 [Trichoderma cornu-damae]
MSSSQNQDPNQRSRPTPARVKSEQDCFRLLALEFASLPDRGEISVSDAATGQQQQQQQQPTASAYTPTNNLIARTIRAAMADIKPGS